MIVVLEYVAMVKTLSASVAIVTKTTYHDAKQQISSYLKDNLKLMIRLYLFFLFMIYESYRKFQQLCNSCLEIFS